MSIIPPGKSPDVHLHTHTQTRNRKLLSHKKEQNFAICSNMDTPRDYHTK